MFYLIIWNFLDGLCDLRPSGDLTGLPISMSASFSWGVRVIISDGVTYEFTLQLAEAEEDYIGTFEIGTFEIGLGNCLKPDRASRLKIKK